MKAIIDEGAEMYCHEPGVEGFKYEAHMRMSEMLKVSIKILPDRSTFFIC